MDDRARERRALADHLRKVGDPRRSRAPEPSRDVPRRRVPAPRAAGVRVRGHAAADRGGADDLAALRRGADGPGGSAAARRVGCSRSGRAPDTRRPSSRGPRGRSTRSSGSTRSPSWPVHACGSSGTTTSTCVVATARLGWPEAAPFDAILVAAGGPDLPASLQDQLAEGGRLIIPVGDTPREQRLVCVERRGGKLRPHRPGRRPLRAPRRPGGVDGRRRSRGRSHPDDRPAAVGNGARPPAARGGRARDRHRVGGRGLAGGEDRRRSRGADRRGDARDVRVLSHAGAHHPRAHRAPRLPHGDDRGRLAGRRAGPSLGARERPRRRAALRSRASRRGCGATGRPPTSSGWLREWNADRPPEAQAGFHGLDLYSLHASIAAVLEYLDRVDPDAAGGRAGALRLPHALAARSRHLRQGRRDRALPALRGRGRGDARRICSRDDSTTWRGTARSTWTPSRTPGWSPTPSATTASCIAEATTPGTSGTGTCSRR